MITIYNITPRSNIIVLHFVRTNIRVKVVYYHVYMHIYASTTIMMLHGFYIISNRYSVCMDVYIYIDLHANTDDGVQTELPGFNRSWSNSV